MRGTWKALFLILLAGCGKPQKTRDGITLDSSVNTRLGELIVSDLEYLDRNPPAAANSEDLQVVNATDFSPPSLKQWLSDRVKYIVGENFDKGTRTQTASFDPGLSPKIFSAETVVTVMANLGAAFYLEGRQRQQIYTVSLDGLSVKVDSPRVGIVQIGEGYLTANQVPGSPYESEANAILRLAVLFHEARHSDGNGNNTAFPHMKCPRGTYQGRYACEGNANGPYAVGSVMLKNYYYACTSCSATEREALLLFLADYRGRIQPGAVYRDPRPERLAF